MKASTLVLSALALIGTSAAVVIHLVQDDAKRRLQLACEQAQTDLTATRSELTAASDRAGVLAERVTVLERDLDQTRSRLEAAETRALGLARDLDTARTAAAQHEAAERQLRAEYEAITAELVQTRLNPAAADPAELERYRQTVATLEAEVARLQTAARERSSPPPLPEQVRVLSVDPENAFVILDFGGGQGAAVNQLLLVRRGSVPLATVEISAVHARHAIAQVVPDSLQGSLRPGDAAILLH